MFSSGDKDSDDSDDSGGGIGGFFGNLFKAAFGGGKALGGMVKPGVAYDVGEMGRETFVPSTPGVIIPHNQLGGGGVSYSVNVANGVTPEQMAVHVRQALQEFHPQVVRSSVQAMQEHSRRNPSSRN